MLERDLSDDDNFEALFEAMKRAEKIRDVFVHQYYLQVRVFMMICEVMGMCLWCEVLVLKREGKAEEVRSEGKWKKRKRKRIQKKKKKRE